MVTNLNNIFTRITILKNNYKQVWNFLNCNSNELAKIDIACLDFKKYFSINAMVALQSILFSNINSSDLSYS